MIDFWSFSIVNVSNFYFHVLFLFVPGCCLALVGDEVFRGELWLQPAINANDRWDVDISPHINFVTPLYPIKPKQSNFGCSENIFSGRVQSSAGERNTCIYTLQKKYTWPQNQLSLIGEPGKCYFKKWHFSHSQFEHFRCQKK